MPSLSQIATILEGLEAASSDWSDAEALFGIITGGGATDMQSQVAALATEIEQGFAEVVNALNQQNLQQQWTYYSDQLNTLQMSLSGWSKELGSLAKVGGVWTVQADSEQQTVTAWCEGPSGTDGALSGLWNLAEQLYDMTQTGGAGNPSLLSLWSELCSAAMSDSNANYAGQTLYTLTYQLMQEFYAILSNIYYCHGSALALYLSLKPSNPNNYVSLNGLITETFGDVSTPDTLWWQFDQQLQGFANAAAQWPGAATTGDTYTGADNYVYFGGQDDGPQTMVFLNATTISQAPTPTNSFFGNLQLVAAPFGSDPEIGALQMVFLAGTPVQVGQNLALKASSPVTSFVGGGWYSGNSYVINKDFVRSCGDSSEAIVNPYYNTGYVTPPAVPNADTINVITGFQIVFVGNRLGIALQFGQLDLSDLSNPTVTVVDETFLQPEPTDFFAIQTWDNWPQNVAFVDLRPSGLSDQSPPCGYPISNVTFAQTQLTPTGNRVGLQLQTAAPIHAATYFQPTSMLATPPSPPS